jgi:hypothetical protein
MPTGHLGPQNYSLLITLAVVVGVVLLRNSRPRRLRIERMWIRPALFLALLVSSLAAAPPPITVASLALMVSALAAGCALGWQRGRFMTIDVHPETHDLTSRASPLGVLFILVLIVLRLWMRTALTSGASLGGVPATAAADALIALAAGMMMTQSLEMWLRARRLLEEAVAAKSATPGGPPIVR